MSCFSSKIIVIVIRCVWWCINSQMLSPSLQTESHSDIFHIDSCSGAANAKNETASLLPLLVSHFIFGLILNGVFFHALKRADWFRRNRPVGCSCGATHLSGRGCISRENLIANERREKKRCRSRNAPAFSHLWCPRFLFLKYSFKLASRSSSIPMLSQENKKNKKNPKPSYYPSESAPDYSSLLVRCVKVDACPSCTAVSVWAAEPFRCGRANLLRGTPNITHSRCKRAFLAARKLRTNVQAHLYGQPLKITQSVNYSKTKRHNFRYLVSK